MRRGKLGSVAPDHSPGEYVKDRANVSWHRIDEAGIIAPGDNAARRRLMHSEKLYRTIVSAFVGLVLFAQASTVLVTATRGTYLRERLFPVLEYPMYAYAHYDGDRVVASWLLEGVYPAGETISISKEMLRVDIFDWVNIVQGAMAGYASSTATLMTLIREHVPNAAQLAELRIKNYPVRITRNGPAAMPSEVVKTLPVPRD
jgi:hypothetical protein